jgi:hypothetical protein
MTKCMQDGDSSGFCRRRSLNVLDTSLGKKGNSVSGTGQDIADAINAPAECSQRQHCEAAQNSCAIAKSSSDQGDSYPGRPSLHFAARIRRLGFFVAVINKTQTATKFYSCLDKPERETYYPRIQGKIRSRHRSSSWGEFFAKGVVIW